ncbi:hypothetical protein EJC49_01815 [Aquibium carbonis]|uniref:Uncharacterized protein n=1 Tax=Aquibium carbonis TaxID=2495581 RepID=A0A429Z388_9HYPH|nr:hypothetical protein EJC49_01815 [Aquibium carbonis]
MRRGRRGRGGCAPAQPDRVCADRRRRAAGRRPGGQDRDAGQRRAVQAAPQAAARARAGGGDPAEGGGQDCGTGYVEPRRDMNEYKRPEK